MYTESKGFKLFIIIFLFFGVLVATHEGEFWPFSIYPMFSQAGKEWTRSMVRDVTMEQDSDSISFKTVYRVEDLPGSTFAMNDVGINQNDVSNFIEKNKDWNEAKRNGLRKLFSGELGDKILLIYKVQGKFTGQKGDSVVIQYQPFIKLDTDTTIIYGP